ELLALVARHARPRKMSSNVSPGSSDSWAEPRINAGGSLRKQSGQTLAQCLAPHTRSGAFRFGFGGAGGSSFLMANPNRPGWECLLAGPFGMLGVTTERPFCVGVGGV